MTDDEIDDLIDEWHESDSELPLHEYLGMTWEEYCKWLELKVSLSSIKHTYLI